MAPPSVVPAVGDPTLVAAALHHVVLVLDKGLTSPSSGLNLSGKRETGAATKNRTETDLHCAIIGVVANANLTRPLLLPRELHALGCATGGDE